MVARLVLGCGRFGNVLVEQLDGDDLLVLDGDAGRVEALRNENVPAEEASPADPDAVAGRGEFDTVIVADDDPATNRAAARIASEAYPDTFRFGYPGEDATDADRDAIAEHVDRLFDPGSVIVEEVVDAVESDDAGRVRRLRAVVEEIDGTLGVFAHDNPDPDAIASGLALVRLAEAWGTPAELCHYGEIAHQENRAFVNLLDIPLDALDDDEVPEYDGIALVDHSRPGVNDGLPPDTEIDVVVDHHPAEEEPTATYVDLRSDVGATSTLLTGYFEHAGPELDETVATALLYGIRVDTNDFSREITAVDFEAAATLSTRADWGILERVESPSMTADTFDTIADAIENRQIRDAALASGVGSITDRDVLAQAADRLLTMEGVQTTLVFGIHEGTVYLSARSRDSGVNLGHVLRDAFADMGSAGGHADMAGAQLPLGLFSEVAGEEESLTAIVSGAIVDRFFDALFD